MKRVRAAYRTPIARSCYPGTSTRRTDHARGLDARASKTEDRAGPKADAGVGAPRWLRPVFRGDETRSARTAAGSEARARFGRRGRARRGSDGRTSRRFPGVARSGAGNNETPDRLAMETGYLGGILQTAFTSRMNRRGRLVP